jgi:hypothetical protein
MLEKGYIRKDIEYSFHITTGDFRGKPGDNFGFDACGKGRKYVEMIISYGTIGSHGGWAHNWFSNGIFEGRISKKDIHSP